MDVKIEGENAVRHLDMTTHNHGTAATAAKPQPCMATLSAASKADQEKCENKKDKHKGKKFIVYIAPVLAGSPPKPTGKYYVGRAVGPAGSTADQVAAIRWGKPHHWRAKTKKRKFTIGPLQPVCETDSYAAVRGAEEAHKKEMEDVGLGAPGTCNATSKKKSKAGKTKLYAECAMAINGKNCLTCGTS
jgi:hypothetical protein